MSEKHLKFFNDDWSKIPNINSCLSLHQYIKTFSGRGGEYPIYCKMSKVR
jgi:hypothetical protein